MPTCQRLISAVETAEQIMNKWSDNESNTIDIVVFRPGNVDSPTDDEEVQRDDVMINNGNVSGTK